MRTRRLATARTTGTRAIRPVNFRGEKRTNATHQSITDPEARLYRKAAGQPSRLCHTVHALMENRNGLLVDVSVAAADGYAEREEALRMVRRTRARQPVKVSTLGADAGYDAGPFLHTLEQEEQVVPNVPTRKGEIVGTDEAAEARRRARQRQQSCEGYRVSQRIRKRVEEIFGWVKTIGGLRRARHVGRWKIGQQALVVGAAYNLLRLARLAPCCEAAARGGVCPDGPKTACSGHTFEGQCAESAVQSRAEAELIHNPPVAPRSSATC